MKHPLHEKVGEAIYTIAGLYGLDVIVDHDCIFSVYPGKAQRIPLFLSHRPARESAVSNVDVVLIKENRIKVVCEIEESGFNPTKIFGKLYSTASAKTCKLSDGTFYEFDNNAFFIQVISNDSFTEQSLKEKQGQLIENEINHKLKLHKSWLKEYRLIYGKLKDFSKKGSEGYDEIERVISGLM